MNDRAAGEDTAASSSIALLHELAQGLRAQVRDSQAGARLPDLIAQLQVANEGLIQAALQTADRIEEAIRLWGAATATATFAATKINDQRSQDLREANERLVLATFKAQDLEHQAEATNRQQFNFMAILAH